MADEKLTSMELRTLITPDGELQLLLEEERVADPSPDEIVIRVEASPITRPVAPPQLRRT